MAPKLTEPQTMLPDPVSFLGCRIHPITTRQFIAWTTSSGRAKRGTKISYLNAHCSNLAADNPAYREAINACDLVYADGQAVVWATRWLGVPVPERVNAGDFILDFCRVCTEKGLSLYLLGSAEGVARRAADEWSRRVPGLRIAGCRAGFFDGEDEERIAQDIRDARSDIVLVGMSAPRQEEWMARWTERLGVRVVWSVGALFEYYSGTRARAPVWMRRAGLEWLFRLVLEPRRLWRRYVFGNVRFAWRVLRAKCGGNRRRD